MSVENPISLKGRGYEIRQSAGFYTVINTTVSGDVSRVHNLWESVKNGIPEKWHLHHEDFWTNSEFFVDKSENPIYFAKTKQYADPKLVRVMQQTPGTWYGLNPKAVVYGFASIMPEIGLSPIVKDVVKSPEMTVLVHDNGYDDIQYVEPLLGMINKEKKQKVMFYDFIDGYDYEQYALYLLSHGQYANREATDKKFDSLAFHLLDIFGKYGILAGDAKKWNFMYPKDHTRNNTLYLIDTEGFVQANRLNM